MRKTLVRVLAGVGAGLVATTVMSAAMALGKAAGMLGEPPPRKLTRRVLGRVGIDLKSKRAVNAASVAAHLAYGATMGALFALAPRKAHSTLAGAAYGLGVWSLNYQALVPRLGLMNQPRNDRPGRPTVMLLSHLIYGATLGLIQHRLDAPVSNLRGKVAVVCGASRGLGLAVARELARNGVSVAVCARTKADLDRARTELASLGVPAFADTCDLRDEDATQDFMRRATYALGPIDIVVTNAATIRVAPIESMSASDVKDDMRSIFDTALHPALCALPTMQERGSGTIAFVTSIGGKVGVPHLASYSAAKFAEVGFAEALRAEVAKDGVTVLTIVPGLMRTGSQLRATFRGQPEKEFGWFAAGAMAPIVSIDAERAARRIVRSIARGDSHLVYTAAARVASRTHDLAPSLWAAVAALAGRLLPKASRATAPSEATGWEAATADGSKLNAALLRRSRDMGRRYNQSS